MYLYYSACVLLCQRCISNKLLMMTDLDYIFLHSRNCPLFIFQCLIFNLKMVAQLKLRSMPSSLPQKKMNAARAQSTRDNCSTGKS